MSSQLRKKFNALIKQPMIIFSLVALVILIVDETLLFDAQSRNVTVSNENLRKYVNVNYGLDNVSMIQSYIDSLDSVDKDALINEYLENEALYYFALNRSLDKDDEELKSVITSKSKNVIEMMVNAEQAPPNDREAKAYFNQHRERYDLGQTYNLMMVNRHDEKAELTEELNSKKHTLRQIVSLSNNHGLDKVYRDIHQQNIIEIFGEEIAKNISQQERDIWHGPYQLENSHHWIKIEENELQSVEYADVADRVKNDLYQELVDLGYQTIIKDLISQMRVRKSV
ncbi:hypothetical protein [Vibrio agarivorans]|uniref:hypothetical protein n=1 Tax=Vibrio agarivorans TaxID=153622 RepID=UPI00222E62E6|nr:hypothetical protein [Vibrio agarivorans]